MTSHRTARTLLPVRSTFYPGSFYLHDLAFGRDGTLYVLADDGTIHAYR